MSYPHSTNKPIDDRLLRAARISFVISVVLMAMKFYAYHLTSSKTILSDALESIVNVVAALAALITMKFVAEPADDEHPYGHGKLEYFSAAFEGGMIAFASIAIGAEAISALMHGSVVHSLSEGIAWIAAAAGGNLLLGLYLRFEGRRSQSEAIKASGTHVLSDVITTVVALASLFVLSLTGIWWIDAVAALAMAGYFGYAGFYIVRRSASGLLDEMDPEILRQLTSAMEKNHVTGVIDIHNLRVMRNGRFHHVDAHLVMPRFWSVSQAHQVGEEFEERVVGTYPYDGEIAFHVDPCLPHHCSVCDLNPCQVRNSKFEKRKSFATLSVTRGDIE